MSLGPRGASVSLTSKGVYQNLGVPGTGLSLRRRLDSSPSRRPSLIPSPKPNPKSLNVAFRLQDDGTVAIVDGDGNPIPPQWERLAREQNEHPLRVWLEDKCDYWNKGIDDVIGIHLKTPKPEAQPHRAVRTAFETPRPSQPVPLPITFLARMFRGKRERIERLNAEALAQYVKDIATWEDACAVHDKREEARLTLFDMAAVVAPGEVQDYLCDVLERVEWPRETSLSLEVDQTATEVSIDVDLPEIEDMPDKAATIAARGLKLNIKDRPPVQRRREYMAHVHGVIFRIVGETFAALPRIQLVTASGFSQRADRTTGHVGDEYLLSVRVSRSLWLALNFSEISHLDVAACLGSFDIRRNMTSTGVFRPIEPFTSLSGNA
jgi:hypothetical protein